MTVDGEFMSEELELRLASLEKRLAALERKRRKKAPPKAHFGWASNDALYEKAMKLGAAYRKSAR